MAIFHRLLLVAILAGLCAGLVTTLAHQGLTVPLILRAEAYEDRAAHTHLSHQDAPSWQPAAGLERTLFTALSDVLTGVGFALLLGALWTWRSAPRAPAQALAWGLAGYLSFVLAPSLGLPPELPGSTAAPLAARQIWWIATALATAGGLGMLVFGKGAWRRVAAVALITLPHFLGAPQADADASTVPLALREDFVRAVLAVGFVFWLGLAASAAYFFGRGEP